MEFIKDLGFNPLLLGGQIVNFLIIYYLLKRFAYKPILGLLKKREEDIKQGIKNAEEGKRVLDNALLEEKRILKNAQAEAEKLIIDSKHHSDMLAKEATESAKKQAEIIIAEARKQINQEAKQVEEKLTRSVAKLAFDFLKKSLSELVSEDSQKQIMQKAVRQLSYKSD